MKKATIFIHPVLLSSYPVLFLFSHNLNILRFNDLWAPLLVIIAAAVILQIFTYLVTRNIDKSSIIVSLSMFTILSYGHIFTFLDSTFFHILLQGKQSIGILAALSALVAFILLIIKTKKNLQPVGSFLNVVSFILLLTILFQIVHFYSNDAYSNILSNRKIYNSNASTPQNTSAELPDIYYFIFDRYGREDTLKNVYHFDNSYFLNYLKGKGFVVPVKSWANYSETKLSLASSLNMDYLNNLLDKLDPESNNTQSLYPLIENYEVWHFLKSKGYYFIHSGSWWEYTTDNNYADKNINISWIPEFSQLVYNQTLLSPLTIKLNIQLFDPRFHYWKRPLYKFDELVKIPNISQPTFTFAHFLITHEPFVFDQNGNYLTEEEVNNKNFQENYREQVIFANKKIAELIDTILEKSADTPPIIILQADEGPYPTESSYDPKSYDWSKASKDIIKEKMAILNAYYLPNGGSKMINDYITPVNTFRVIFNYYFNQKLEILPNVSYLSNQNKPFKFIEIKRDPD